MQQQIELLQALTLTLNPNELLQALVPKPKPKPKPNPNPNAPGARTAARSNIRSGRV